MKTVMKWALYVVGCALLLTVLGFAIFGVASAVHPAPAVSAEASCDQAVSDATTPIQNLLDQANADLKAAKAAGVETQTTLDQAVTDLAAANVTKTEIQGNLDKANADLAAATAINATLQQKLDEALAKVPALVLPPDFNGSVATYDFVGGLPAYIDLRNTNRVAGDRSAYVIKFTADFPRIGILRLVCDDNCVSAQYFASPTATPVDLLPLLEMGVVDSANPPDAYMVARGVNWAEQLAQNYRSVNLGEVKAASGAYILVIMKDDPALSVNNGGLIAFTSDTDPFTKNIDGSIVTDPSFVLQP